MSQQHAQLQIAHTHTRRQAAENRIMTIHNDTLILNRRIIAAQARVDALEHDRGVLDQQDTDARIEVADAIEEIRRLMEDIAMAGGHSRRNRKRTHRKHNARHI